MATANSSVTVTLDTKAITEQLRAVIEALSNIDLSAPAFTAKVKAAEEAEAKKAHDDLRTSPIALKALEIYNRACIGCGPYESWDATLDGDGVGDDTIRHFIGLAEAEEAKEKEAAEKLAARRDAVAEDYFNWNYEGLTANGKRTVRRIIELEDKAA